MSLQVWLPLTKDTRNQGLVNIVSNNNAVTFTNGGKLGEKYFSAGTITIPASYSSSIFNGTHISFSFWLKPIGTDGTSVIFGQSSMNVGNNRMYSIFQYPTPNDLHISWQSETSSSTFVTFTRTGFFEANKWTHCALVYDGSKVLVYKNGVLNSTYDGVNTRTAFNYDYPINASSIRCLNDFRIYDHCLSPMEVKELAKGLVLHYPLNRQGWGQDNNIKTSVVANRGCSNFIYNSVTNTWSMSAPINSSAWGFGIVFNDTSIKWKSGESWVVSMEVYVPKAMTWNHDINNKPDVSDVSPYTGNDYDDQRLYCSNGVMSSHSLKAGWNKIWFSQRAPGTYGLYNYSTNFGVVTTSESAAISIQIRNIKGEVTGIGLPVQPTSWCPNSSDTLATTMGLNSTTEYDCSGFCNNGTRTGTFTWTSDVSKYNVSTQFTRGASSLTTPSPSFITEGSVAMWVKVDTLGTSGWLPFSGQDGSHYCLATASGTGNFYNDNIGSGTISYYYDGQKVSAPTSLTTGWHHVVITGINLSSWTMGRLNAYGSQAQTNWNSTVKYSDFRIYATALSASDVKSLYQNSAYIDSSGNVYGAVHMEV